MQVTTETKIPTTREVIISLLKENTGASLCDSGGAYGRHHERNQKLSESELMDNECTWELPYMRDERFKIMASNDLSEVSDMFAIRQTGAVMEEQLTYTKACHELNKRFIEFAEKSDNYWINEFLEQIGAEIGISENTYNGAYALSQDLQFTMFGLDGKQYVFVQVHGGCDIRGGYSHPVIFEQTSDFVWFSPYPFGDLESTDEPVDPEVKDWILETAKKKGLELQRLQREFAADPEKYKWERKSLERKIAEIPRMQDTEVDEHIFLNCTSEGYVEQIDGANDIAYDAERELFFVPSQRNPVYYKMNNPVV